MTRRERPATGGTGWDRQHGRERQHRDDGRDGRKEQDEQVGRVGVLGRLDLATLVAVLCIAIVSGFPPTLRPLAAELGRDHGEARSANTGSRTFAQAPKSEMTRVPQFENERAVSWKSVIPPHTESTPHRHDRYRTVIGLVGGYLTTVDPQGRKTVTHYETGKSYWQEPMPPGAMHKDVNETGNTIELLVVEMK